MEVGAGRHDSAPPPGGAPDQREAFGAGKIAALVVVAVLIGVAVGFGSHLLLSRRASAPPTVAHRPSGLEGEATWAAGARSAPAIDTLHDQNGRLFSLASLDGQTVVEFFDSHCKQECPLASGRNV